MSKRKKKKSDEEEIRYFKAGGKMFRQPRRHEIESGKTFHKAIYLQDVAVPSDKWVSIYLHDVRLAAEELAGFDVQKVESYQKVTGALVACWDEKTPILIPVPLCDKDAVRYGYESCVVCGRTKEHLYFGDEDGGISVEGNNAFLECTCSGCKSEYNLVFKLDGVGGGVKIFGESASK